MEIMGIAIIMVLFSIGMLIFLGVVMKPKQSVRSSLDLSEFATNFITVLARTNTPCNGATVERLLKDIASYDEKILCEGVSYSPGFGAGTSGTTTSLAYLQGGDSPITYALDHAFYDHYQRDYFFTYCPFDPQTKKCDCSSGSWNSATRRCGDLGTPFDDSQPLYFSSYTIGAFSGGFNPCPIYTLKTYPIPTDRGAMSLVFWICDQKQT